jgi:hypothetical protein
MKRRSFPVLFNAPFRVSLAVAPLLAIGLLGGCSQSPSASMVTVNPGTPGWTGRTIIPGNNSTIAGNAEATEQQQKWPIGRGR